MESVKVARSYQKAALDGGDHRGRGCFKEWEEYQSTLICAATGTGKTRMAADIINRFEGRVFFAVHLRKIVRQAAKEFRKLCKGRSVAIEMANSSVSSFAPEDIVVASVQTANSKGRLDNHNPFEYSLLIIDECHRSTGDSYRVLFRHFKQNPNLKILLLSATPKRHDGKPLSAVCESVAYTYPLKDAIADCYLVPIRQQFAFIPGLDYSLVKKVAGDLNKKGVSLAWEDAKVLHSSVQASVEAVFGLYPRELEDIPEESWSDYIGDRKPKTTVGFTVNVKHATFMANALNHIRPGLADWVCGETDYDESQRKFLAFEHGRCPVMFNYGILIEGYDHSAIELILDMQPTLSLTRFTQKVGRATRTLEGTIDGLETAGERKEAIKNSKKPFATLINFCGKQGKHKIVSSFDLLGGTMTPQVKARVEERAKKEAIDIDEAIKDAQEEERQREIEALAAKTVKTNYDLAHIDIFTGKKKKAKLSRLQKASRAEALAKQPISKKNFELLKKQGLNPAKRTEAENKELLKKITHRKLSNLCSYSQAFKLQKLGYTNEQIAPMKSWEATSILQFNVLRKYDYTKEQFDGMTYQQRSSAIDAIARNGWRRPPHLFVPQTNPEVTYGAPAF